MVAGPPEGEVEVARVVCDQLIVIQSHQTEQVVVGAEHGAEEEVVAHADIEFQVADRRIPEVEAVVYGALHFPLVHADEVAEVLRRHPGGIQVFDEAGEAEFLVLGFGGSRVEKQY